MNDIDQVSPQNVDLEITVKPRCRSNNFEQGQDMKYCVRLQVLQDTTGNPFWLKHSSGVQKSVNIDEMGDWGRKESDVVRKMMT